MDTETKIDETLAHRLSEALWVVWRQETRTGRRTDGSDRRRLGVARWITDDDHLAKAIAAELDGLFERDGQLVELMESAKGPEGRKRLEHHIEERLRQEDKRHLRQSLLELISYCGEYQKSGTILEKRTREPTKRIGRLELWLYRRSRRPKAWLERQIPLILMHALIAVPIVVALVAVPGGAAGTGHSTGNSGADIATALMKIFAIGVLSFLPPWLYIRFLRQRATSLWNEYVIYLHRLGMDEPQNLPRPPRSSEFWDPWLYSGGYLQDEKSNLYRQKFDAFYGSSAASSATDTGSPVKVESLFPIFLTTAVLAVCWTAVMWNLDFVVNLETRNFWSFLKFGFLGAYFFTSQSLIRRYFQADLRPSAYASLLLRIIIVFLILAVVYPLTGTISRYVLAATAFVIGWFPIAGEYAIRRATMRSLGKTTPTATRDYSLNRIDGLNVWYAYRLVEEGIEDMQSLVTANLVDLILHTRVPVGRLVDWIDQAQLYLHLPPENKKGVGGDSGDVGPELSRRKLREYGIRTATDVLNTFGSHRDGEEYPAVPKPAELDSKKLGILVHVLEESSDLSPIEKWQRGSADFRREHGEDPPPRKLTPQLGQVYSTGHSPK
ncbi:hypothetical protein [Nocardia vaccinii]|uniref:hypothetical protein n=1 Tax=Nocardia vaccinii TaxID=1822 RepID=UPI00082A9DCE|nr:hypothetical protein [Nocardia vaccinii]